VGAPIGPAAAIIHVAPDGSGDYATIQAAIDAAWPMASSPAMELGPELRHEGSRAPVRERT
jgi:hypothetical protein